MSQINNSKQTYVQSPLPLSNSLVVERVPLSAVTLKDRLLKKISKRSIATTMANLEKYGQVLPTLVTMPYRSFTARSS
jgi:hypothetical protein